MYVDVILHCTQLSALSSQHSALSSQHSLSQQHPAEPEHSAAAARYPKPKTLGNVGTVVSLFLFWSEVMMTKKFQNSKFKNTTKPDRHSNVCIRYLRTHGGLGAVIV
jgi:hypothetical protein